jgi:hypothetical protein
MASSNQFGPLKSSNLSGERQVLCAWTRRGRRKRQLKVVDAWPRVAALQPAARLEALAVLSFPVVLLLECAAFETRGLGVDYVRDA